MHLKYTSQNLYPFFILINRPDVARAVLQTTLSLIDVRQSGEASRLRVCYQRSLPCLVSWGEHLDGK